MFTSDKEVQDYFSLLFDKIELKRRNRLRYVDVYSYVPFSRKKPLLDFVNMPDRYIATFFKFNAMGFYFLYNRDSIHGLDIKDLDDFFKYLSVLKTRILSFYVNN